MNKSMYYVVKAVLAFCVLLLMSCSSENAPQKELFIKLDVNSLFFECEGGSSTITISSNDDWTVSGKPEWCEVSPQTGNGNATVTITVSENEASVERTATLIFTCGTEIAKLEILQAENMAFETNYKKVDWESNTVSGYNENTGEITIECQDGVPTFEKDKAIVLPVEYGSEIRVIKSATVSGNKVTLQTERGNMCHLFIDTSFTLSTDPSAALRSTDGNKVITPTEIGVMTDNGYVPIYKKSDMMRAEVVEKPKIYSFGQDYSGTDLYNKDGERVFWEKFTFDIGFDAVFSFEFGRTVVDKITIGDLKMFEFYLNGDLNIDLILKYVLSGQKERSGDFLLKENAINQIVASFTVGTIPVVVFIDTHLHAKYDFEAKSEITMSAGCNTNINSKIGFGYTRDAGFTPILSVTPTFTPHAPAFTAKGSLYAKGSVYPKFVFQIYRCLCPWVDLMPYLKENFEAGMRLSTDGNSYLGWNAKRYVGMDVRMGIKTDFGMLIPFMDIWNSETYNPIDYLLLEQPKKIELLSPADGTELTAKQPVDVTFKVSYINNFTEEYSPCFAGLVNFETAGSVDRPVAISSKDGIVTVEWTPKNNKDRLTAKVVDKDGNTISETTFTPEYDDDEEEQIREMLVKLYHDTDGDNWRRNDNWLSDKPIDEWYGITYSQGSLVIELGYNNLSGSMDVSDCISLENLSCYDNQLTSLNVRGCSNLRYLECINNQLISLNVRDCSSLHGLYCDNNQLTSLDVSDCSSLRYLDCYDNRILSVISTWFSQLNKFQYDVRYSYYNEDGEAKYTDRGVGWWYPGEPEKGYHGR